MVMSSLARRMHSLTERVAWPTLKPRSHKEIEHLLDHLLAARGQLVGQQEQQIDVGLRRQFAAAVAADGDDGEPLAGGPDWPG